jgi:transposase
MTAATAAPEPTKGTGSRRAWNRRPPSRRLDLTPEQIAALEEEQKRQKRTRALHVQLTPDERGRVETRARSYGRSLSDFVRIVLLSDLKEPPPPALDPAIAGALIYQLQKIGGNLNQLSKHANETRAMPEAAAIAEVIGLLKATLSRIVP